MMVTTTMTVMTMITMTMTYMTGLSELWKVYDERVYWLSKLVILCCL